MILLIMIVIISHMLLFIFLLIHILCRVPAAQIRFPAAREGKIFTLATAAV